MFKSGFEPGLSRTPVTNVQRLSQLTRWKPMDIWLFYEVLSAGEFMQRRIRAVDFEWRGKTRT
jgi:hypothetical protein